MEITWDQSWQQEAFYQKPSSSSRSSSDWGKFIIFGSLFATYLSNSPWYVCLLAGACAEIAYNAIGDVIKFFMN